MTYEELTQKFEAAVAAHSSEIAAAKEAVLTAETNLSAVTAKVAELEKGIAALTGERDTLAAKVTELETKQQSVNKVAATLVTNAAIAPLAASPAQTGKVRSLEELMTEYQSKPTAKERRDFFLAHRKELLRI